MWIFGEWGLVMPVLSDPIEDKNLATEKWTQGKYFLQVRGRMREHLQYFMDNYMEPGTFTDEIQYVPTHDYVYRFYTDHESFAAAVAKAVMDIDYRHFKDNAKKKRNGKYVYERATEYASGLLSVWTASTTFGEVGGYYGPKTRENPKGYSSTGSHSGIGSSFGDRLFTDDDDWETYRDVPAELLEEYSDKEARIDQILRALKGIPAIEWADYLSESDWLLVKDIAVDQIEIEWEQEQVEKERREKRRVKRQQKQSRYKNRKGQKALVK